MLFYCQILEGRDGLLNALRSSGLPSPRASVSRELASLGAAAPGPAPTWGKVLGSLKLWGITPASQSAAATPVPPHRDPGLRGGVPGRDVSSQSRRQLNLSDSENEVVEAQSRALSETDALRAPGGSGSGRAGPLRTVSAQQRDRMFSSLDSSQVRSLTAAKRHPAFPLAPRTPATSPISLALTFSNFSGACHDGLITCSYVLVCMTCDVQCML